MKKSLGVYVRFTDGHEEKYEHVEHVIWEETVVYLGIETTVDRKVRFDAIAQFDRKYIIGIIDYYDGV